MDTKSRSNNPSESLEIEELIKKVSTKKKLNPVLIFTIFLLTVAAIFQSIGYIYSRDTTEYSVSNKFQYEDELIRYAKNINRFFCYFEGYDYKFDDKNIEQLERQINEIQLKYDGIIRELDNKYEYEFQNLEDKGLDELSNDLKNAEIDNEHRKIESDKLYEMSELENKITLYKENNINYEEILNYIENISTYKYYLEDHSNNKVMTNINGHYEENSIGSIDINNYLKSEAYLYIPLNDKLLNENLFSEKPISLNFAKKNMTGYLIITNSFYNEMTSSETNDFEMLKSNINSFKIFAIASFTFLIFLLITNTNIVEWFTSGSSFYFKIFIKIPFLIKCFGLLGLILVIPNILFSINNKLPFIGVHFLSSSHIFQIIFYAFIFLLIIIYIKFFIQISETKKIFNEKEVVFMNKLNDTLSLINKSGKTSTIIFFYLSCVTAILVSFVLGIYLLNILFEGYMPTDVLFLSIIFAFAYFVCLFFWIHYITLELSLQKLNVMIKKIYDGEDISDIKETKFISESSNKLKNIKKGFNESIDKMIKSERTKTELITNVSHDLKTPLTSIINYIDLLKSEGITSNNANEYLDILSQKSERLKYLIEDLFEVSKLTSKNVELNYSLVNVIDLLNQSIGELNEKFHESKIDLRVNFPKNDIYLNLDGKKIWRVFENLLTNITKYSMPDTRAYIDVKDSSTNVLITFKNISNHEINFESRELLERFKRGDSSRATDGNGLGLSIAESIVNLHGGSLNVITDGDLFKVEIELFKN